jgi:hypothetical protein
VRWLKGITSSIALALFSCPGCYCCGPTVNCYEEHEKTYVFNQAQLDQAPAVVWAALSISELEQCVEDECPISTSPIDVVEYLRTGPPADFLQFDGMSSNPMLEVLRALSPEGPLQVLIVPTYGVVTLTSGKQAYRAGYLFDDSAASNESKINFSVGVRYPDKNGRDGILAFPCVAQRVNADAASAGEALRSVEGECRHSLESVLMEIEASNRRRGH